MNRFTPSGYYVGFSYIGILPGGRKCEFVSREDYIEFLEDHYGQRSESV